MIELRWRLAKGHFVSKPVDPNFIGHGEMMSVFVSEEQNAIEFVTGKHVVLQMRQVQNTIEVVNELHSPIWGEWEDVPVDGIESKSKTP